MSQLLFSLWQAITPRWLHVLQSCKEDFPKHGRLVYSTVTMVIMYLLPTITISVAYYQVPTHDAFRQGEKSVHA